MKNSRLCFTVILTILFTALFAQNSNKSDFENREVINITGINTEHFEGFPMIMADGLTMYFSSDRPGGFGDLDIYVVHRNTRNDQWVKPIHLNSNINSVASDHSVTISEDGHYMYFTSEKTGGYGDADLYMSYRDDITNDLGWGKAQNLGELVNTPKIEACPFFHVEHGKTELYFVSSKENGLGGMDFYYSIWDDKANKFQKPIWLREISSDSEDMHYEPVGGLIWSNRGNGKGKHDIWIANKDKTNKWDSVQVLEYPINTEHNEGMPSITHDLGELYFHSNRPKGKGSYDIYLAIRRK